VGAATVAHRGAEVSPERARLAAHVAFLQAELAAADCAGDTQTADGLRALLGFAWRDLQALDQQARMAGMAKLAAKGKGAAAADKKRSDTQKGKARRRGLDRRNRRIRESTDGAAELGELYGLSADMIRKIRRAKQE